MARIPINKDMLAWAMNDAAVSPDEIATITGRPRTEVDKWLTGTLTPHKGDLATIAARVGRSSQFFLLSRPPSQQGPAALFRGAVTGESRDAASELKALRRAGRMQKFLRWAAEAEGGQPVSLPSPDGSAEEFASQVRVFLGWRDTDQTKATSKTAVYKKLRRRVEALGVAVVFIDAGQDNCRGFSLPDPLAPVIALNSSYKMPSLRSFTLLHEFAHLSRGDAAVCHSPDRAEERWCDEFASAFLLPEDHLRAYFAYKKWTHVEPSQIKERVRLTSNRYRASWQAVAIRLRQLGLAGQSVVDEVFNNSGEESGSGFNAEPRRVPDIRLDEYGSTFTRAVITLRDDNKLSEFDARQQLRVDGGQFDTLKRLAAGAA